jgi:hypothetical protein
MAILPAAATADTATTIGRIFASTAGDDISGTRTT